MTHADRRQNFVNNLRSNFYKSLGLSRSHFSFSRHPVHDAELESWSFYCIKTRLFSGIETTPCLRISRDGKQDFENSGIIHAPRKSSWWNGGDNSLDRLRQR